MVDSRDTETFKSLTTITPEEEQDTRHRFIRIGDTVFTAISKDLVSKFNISEKTWAYQCATENGIYIAFKDNKRTAGQ